jgi:hypothetical protein
MRSKEEEIGIRGNRSGLNSFSFYFIFLFICLFIYFILQLEKNHQNNGGAGTWNQLEKRNYPFIVQACRVFLHLLISQKQKKK